MRYIAYLEAESSSPELVGIIRVVHADSTAIEAATFASRDMTCPSWTPRGELVAARGSVRDGASLQVLTLDGNETTRASGAFLPGQLSPDGSAVVTLTYDLQRSLSWVERWSMVGGSVTRLYPRGLNWPGYEDTPPQWSPDGALIAYGSYAYGIILIDASNGEPQWLGDTWGSDYDMGFWPFGDDPTFVPPGVSYTR
jgi:Tol biopolymer transport system component